MNIALHYPLLVENSVTHIGAEWGYAMANPTGSSDGFGDGLFPLGGDGVGGDGNGNGEGYGRVWISTLT